MCISFKDCGEGYFYADQGKCVPYCKIGNVTRVTTAPACNSGNTFDPQSVKGYFRNNGQQWNYAYSTCCQQWMAWQFVPSAASKSLSFSIQVIYDKILFNYTNL